MLSQNLGHALFAELLSSAVECFAYAVSVECQRVSREELQFPYRAIPFLKESEYGGRRVELLKSVVFPKAGPIAQDTLTFDLSSAMLNGRR